VSGAQAAEQGSTFATDATGDAWRGFRANASRRSGQPPRRCCAIFVAIGNREFQGFPQVHMMLFRS